MLVLIDELVNLYKIPNAITRQYNYEKILTMYNDTLQGKAQYLGMIMGGHANLHRRPRRRMFSYEALRSRLAQGRFAREDLKDMLAPIIRLQPLTYEELLVLIKTHANSRRLLWLDAHAYRERLGGLPQDRVRSRGSRHASDAA